MRRALLQKQYSPRQMAQHLSHTQNCISLISLSSSIFVHLMAHVRTHIFPNMTYHITTLALGGYLLAGFSRKKEIITEWKLISQQNGPLFPPSLYVQCILCYFLSLAHTYNAMHLCCSTPYDRAISTTNFTHLLSCSAR